MHALAKAFLSRAALQHNLKLLAYLTHGTPLCVMVKADAYGHGIKPVATGIGQAAFWGVATFAEALELRKFVKRAPILILRPVGAGEESAHFAEQVAAMRNYGLRPTIVGEACLGELARLAARSKTPLPVQIKIDTGMGRNGCPAANALRLIELVRAQAGLRIEGIYSHFAGADERDLALARRQLAAFRRLLAKLDWRGQPVPIRHMANSGAIFNLPQSHFDLVRPGIALYGYAGRYIRGSQDLRPILRLTAPVVLTKLIKTGATCGYGATFRARRPTRIGLLPVGYADGYDRRWSNMGKVCFKQHVLPVIGRVSMDLTIVDLTDAPQAGIGDMICLISEKRNDPHSVESMARSLGTIPYEITCALGRRIERILVDEFPP